MNIFAQIPTPVTIPTPTAPVTSIPTGNTPASGDFWNPSNWAALAQALGLGGFLAIVLLITCGLLVWQLLKQRNQPSNAEQLTRITSLVKLLCKDSRDRSALIRTLIYAQTTLLVAIGDAVKADTKASSEEIRKLLISGPPPVPTELAITLDDSQQV